MKEMQAGLSAATLRTILVRDDVESLKNALDEDLDPTAWLDADPLEALLAVATLADSIRCVELLLDSGGDWALGAPFDEDLDSPLSIAICRGSDRILNAFVQKEMVEKYPIEWLREATKNLMDRGECEESLLTLLEAIGSRPEELSQLVAEPVVVKFVRKKAQDCARAEKCRNLADRWSTMARRLGDAETQVELILKEVEGLAANGHKSRLRKFLRSLTPDLRGEAAGRALVYMAAFEDWDFAGELLDMNADCTVKNSGGWTALMFASRNGNLGLVRKLLAGGADLHARHDGPRGESAIQMAKSPMIRRYLEKVAAQGGK